MQPIYLPPPAPTASSDETLRGNAPPLFEVLVELAGPPAPGPPPHRESQRRAFLEWLLWTPRQQKDDHLAYLSNCQKGNWASSSDSPAFGRLVPTDLPGSALSRWEADSRFLFVSPRRHVSYVATTVKQSRGSIALSLKILSRELEVAPHHLGREFGEHAGISFRRYLQAVRTLNAVNLLANTCFSVKEIASILGYTEPSNFCNEFLKEVGTSPSRYRNELPAPISVPPPFLTVFEQF